MDKSRQRNAQKKLNDTFIIKSQKVWYRELILAFFTLSMWLYALTVIYFFTDALFSWNHKYPSLFRIIFKMTSTNIKTFLFISVFLFIAIYLIVFLWSFYNKKRYGSLRRREYPVDTNKEDLMNLRMLDEFNYERLQNSKITHFEVNPIIKKGRYSENNR